MRKRGNMARVKYYTKDGVLVVGVTTVLGIIAKPNLIHWAWKLGMDGKDYRQVRDSAADIGTLAHYLIKCHLKKEEPDLKSYSQVNIDKAKKAFEAFLEFEKRNNMQPIIIEQSFVSDKNFYGGTPDWYGKVNGKLTLVDFKTSKGLYPEMRLQLAAYGKLLEENGHKVEDTHLLQIDKETGEFHHHIVNDLEESWKLFYLLLQAYPIKKKLWKD